MPLNERIKKMHEMHCDGCSEYGGHGTWGRMDSTPAEDPQGTDGGQRFDSARLHHIMEGLEHITELTPEGKLHLMADFFALSDEEVLTLSRMVNNQYGHCGDDSMFSPAAPFLCSLDSGHSGPHKAYGVDKEHPIAVWDRGTGTA